MRKRLCEKDKLNESQRETKRGADPRIGEGEIPYQRIEGGSGWIPAPLQSRGDKDDEEDADE